MDKEVKRIADLLGVKSIGSRRPVSKKTLISDLKDCASRLGAPKSIFYPKRR